MPVIEKLFCDHCEVEMENGHKNPLHIYRIEFWSNINHNIEKKDFLLENNISTVLCSKECLGEFVYILINGKE